MISKKNICLPIWIYMCIMKQGTIKNASRYLKNANVLANDFKQFLASCHVQQVNNLYVFIILIFIDSDSYRYLEYYTIH